MAPEPPATAKGERRRRALLDAAVEVLLADGFAGISHRAVAARAGLPLAATTYYFSSREELAAEAVRHALSGRLDEVRGRVQALPEGGRSARTTAEVFVGALLLGERDDARLLAYYEQFVAAGRHGRVREVLRAGRAELDQVLAEALRRCGRAEPPVPLAVLVAAADGAALSALVEGAGHARAAAVDAVTVLLGRG